MKENLMCSLVQKVENHLFFDSNVGNQYLKIVLIFVNNDGTLIIYPLLNLNNNNNKAVLKITFTKSITVNTLLCA